ncbi:hypothetical protein V5F77_04975 [Xanthobacter sp. DSM 24535]|uniref:hypothetical protein n=1 Tax=Roseixanthobacter psychrophilus TaxID=3119917 RepID=UPI00372C7470
MNKGLITRRDFTRGLIGTSGAALLPRRSLAAELAGKFDIGLIRWDAWYAKFGSSVFAQNNLAGIYRDRAPDHCAFPAQGEIECSGTQADMDDEIRLAAEAKVGYWAFCWYSNESSLRRAWTLYQSSALKNKVKWCAILPASVIGSVPFSASSVEKNFDFWISQFKQNEYYKTMNEGRPLLFLLFSRKDVLSFNNDVAVMTETFAAFKKAVRARLSVDPFIVAMTRPATLDKMNLVGADGLSSYVALMSGRGRQTYAELDRQTQNYWQALAATRKQIIPIAMTGWDIRPRLDNPVPWEGQRSRESPYFDIATPEEFRRHILAGLEFINAHPESCATRSLLVYSWDECDEGGCILPTYGDPKAGRLSALALALRQVPQR